MALGQSGGPPASAKQLAYLLALVKQAGHTGFRDARHPLGLTQRQAGGKFTVSEASALIDQLVNGEQPDAPADDRRAEQAAAKLAAQQLDLVRGMPAELLADELRRRGWSVNEP